MEKRCLSVIILVSIIINSSFLVLQERNSQSEDKMNWSELPEKSVKNPKTLYNITDQSIDIRINPEFGVLAWFYITTQNSTMFDFLPCGSDSRLENITRVEMQQIRVKNEKDGIGPGLVISVSVNSTKVPGANDQKAEADHFISYITNEWNTTVLGGAAYPLSATEVNVQYMISLNPVINVLFANNYLSSIPSHINNTLSDLFVLYFQNPMASSWPRFTIYNPSIPLDSLSFSMLAYLPNPDAIDGHNSVNLLDVFNISEFRTPEGPTTQLHVKIENSSLTPAHFEFSNFTAPEGFSPSDGWWGYDRATNISEIYSNLTFEFDYNTSRHAKEHNFTMTSYLNSKRITPSDWTSVTTEVNRTSSIDVYWVNTINDPQNISVSIFAGGIVSKNNSMTTSFDGVPGQWMLNYYMVLLPNERKWTNHTFVADNPGTLFIHTQGTSNTSGAWDQNTIYYGGLYLVRGSPYLEEQGIILNETTIKRSLYEKRGNLRISINKGETFNISLKIKNMESCGYNISIKNIGTENFSLVENSAIMIEELGPGYEKTLTAQVTAKEAGNYSSLTVIVEYQNCTGTTLTKEFIMTVEIEVIPEMAEINNFLIPFLFIVFFIKIFDHKQKKKMKKAINRKN